MKLNGKVMVAVVMMVGALGATGCNAAARADGAAADQGDAMAQAAANWFGVRPLPPPLRVEVQGPRPSPAHVWAPGYWRWDDRQTVYVWAPGYWTLQYATYAPPAPRVEVPGNPPSDRHFWVNGHWSWNGSQYVWVGGHWDVRRDGFVFVQPHWDNVNGRWTHVPGHWARA